MQIARIRRDRWLCGAALLLAACAQPAPPPIAPPAAPDPPLSFGPLRRQQEIRHELSFTTRTSYKGGLELHFLLVDRAGQVLQRSKLHVGPIYAKSPPLAPGRELVWLLRRPEDLIKVVGRPRPRSPLAPPDLDLSRVARARLLQIFACRRETFVWSPGMRKPDGMTRPPPLGTVVWRNVCDRGRQVSDAALERSFRYRRRLDAREAAIEVRARFGRDYPSGLSFVVELRDRQGQLVDADCQIQVQQPPVYHGQAMDYRITFEGAEAVARFARVHSVGHRALIPHAGDAHDLTVRRVCAP